MLFWLQLLIIIITTTTTIIIIIIIIIIISAFVCTSKATVIWEHVIIKVNKVNKVIQKLNPIFEVASYKQPSRRNVYFVKQHYHVYFTLPYVKTLSKCLIHVNKCALQIKNAV